MPSNGHANHALINFDFSDCSAYVSNKQAAVDFYGLRTASIQNAVRPHDEL